jgi:hypothetical protein
MNHPKKGKNPLAFVERMCYYKNNDRTSVRGTFVLL